MKTYGWCIFIKYRFPSNVKGIALIERIPLEILKSPNLSKLSGEFFLTSQNSALYHLQTTLNFKKVTFVKSIPQSAPWNWSYYKFDIPIVWIITFNTFVLFLLPFFIIKEIKRIEYPRFWTEARFVFYWTHRTLVLLLKTNRLTLIPFIWDFEIMHYTRELFFFDRSLLSFNVLTIFPPRKTGI